MVRSNRQVMEDLFPLWKVYPKDSMTPVLFDTEEGTEVAFLILGNEELLQDFIHEKGDGMVVSEISVYPESNGKGIGTDIVIRFKFFFPTGSPMFESVIYGDMPTEQKEMCKALLKVDNVFVFIASNEFEYLKFKRLEWSGGRHPLITKLLG